VPAIAQRKPAKILRYSAQYGVQTFETEDNGKYVATSAFRGGDVVQPGTVGSHADRLRCSFAVEQSESMPSQKASDVAIIGHRSPSDPGPARSVTLGRPARIELLDVGGQVRAVT
jgi:hypothetical protein